MSKLIVGDHVSVYQSTRVYYGVVSKINHDGTVNVIVGSPMVVELIGVHPKQCHLHRDHSIVPLENRRSVWLKPLSDGRLSTKLGHVSLEPKGPNWVEFVENIRGPRK